MNQSILTKMNGIVENFNNLALDLLINIADVCPNSIVGTNLSSIKSLFRSKTNKDKIITVFIEKILIYKDKIKNGEEDFFLNKSYDNDLDNDTSLTSKVFEFKNIWTELNPENKQIVISFMSYLCDLAEEYFILFTRLN